MGTPSDKDVLDRADKSFNAVSKLTPRPLKIQKAIIGGWWDWAKDTAKKISKDLGGDPPRQDYNQTTLPVWHTWPPVQPDASVSIARAAALNAVSAALADVNAYGTAATVALDRYGGASEANNLEWAAQQANARLYLSGENGRCVVGICVRVGCFRAGAHRRRRDRRSSITAGDVISYQQRLVATGFTAQEIADAHLVGLTDADIEEFRQGIIAANPATSPATC